MELPARLPRRRRVGPVPVIALGVGIGGFAMSFWVPFTPIYLQELGAASATEAVAWAGVAFMGLGVARLVVSPLWGVLADRFGRKLMYVRALWFASLTTAIVALATEPWHVVAAFVSQGLLSGYIPAATALVSVSVPEKAMGQALGTVNAAQYLGVMLGPLAGAGLATVFGLRGSFAVAAGLPALMAILAMVTVPRDRLDVASRPAGETSASTTGAGGGPIAGARARLASFRDALRELDSLPVRLGILLTFLVLAASQALRLVIPVILAGTVDDASLEGAVGLAVALSGMASAAGVTIARRWLVAEGMLAIGLVGCTIVSAVGAALMAAFVGGPVPALVAAFALVSLATAATVPATNTIIAIAVPRSRRGTVFGLNAAAQALAFIVGPLSATLFAATSFGLGFLGVALAFAATAALVRWKLPAATGSFVRAAPDGPATPESSTG